MVPTLKTMEKFCEWMTALNLGRKRILDTMLAATYFCHDVHVIVSSNARDDETFNCFKIITPE